MSNEHSIRGTITFKKNAGALKLIKELQDSEWGPHYQGADPVLELRGHELRVRADIPQSQWEDDILKFKSTVIDQLALRIRDEYDNFEFRLVERKFIRYESVDIFLSTVERDRLKDVYHWTRHANGKPVPEKNETAKKPTTKEFREKALMKVFEKAALRGDVRIP